MCGHTQDGKVVHDHYDFRTPTISPTGKYVHVGHFEWEHYDPDKHGPIGDWLEVGDRMTEIPVSHAGVAKHAHPAYGQTLSSTGSLEYIYDPNESVS